MTTPSSLRKRYTPGISGSNDTCSFRWEETLSFLILSMRSGGTAFFESTLYGGRSFSKPIGRTFTLLALFDDQPLSYVYPARLQPVQSHYLIHRGAVTSGYCIQGIALYHPVHYGAGIFGLRAALCVSWRGCRALGLCSHWLFVGQIAFIGWGAHHAASVIHI